MINQLSRGKIKGCETSDREVTSFLGRFVCCKNLTRNGNDRGITTAVRVCSIQLCGPQTMLLNELAKNRLLGEGGGGEGGAVQECAAEHSFAATS